MRVTSSPALKRAFCLQFLAAFGPLLWTPAAQVDGADWLQWRGPNQSNTSSEKGLLERWDPDGGPGSNRLWKNEEVGGRSTPIVMKGRLYTLARHNPDTGTEQSKFVCVDASTEEKLWEHISSISLTDVPNTRVAWSSCVGDPETGRVYAHGVSGDFCCLEAETGAVVWERKLHEEFGVLSTYGGRTNFPLVFDDLVIASGVIIGWGDSSEWGSLAKPAHRFLSMDTQTGEVHWLKGTGISPYDTTYSTPLFADGKVYHCTNNGWWYILEPTDRGVKVLLKLRLKGQSSDGSPIAAQNRVYLPTSATVYCLATDEPLRFYSWASHDYPASASWDFSPGKEIWYTMKHRGEQCGDSAAISGKI